MAKEAHQVVFGEEIKDESSGHELREQASAAGKLDHSAPTKGVLN